MPQVVLKNVSKQHFENLAGIIAEKIAEVIEVPSEHIVVEYSETSFIRGGKQDKDSAMAWIYWKKRTPELQEKVAKVLADILMEVGYRPVEVIYQNLDMNDFYEYK